MRVTRIRRAGAAVGAAAVLIGISASPAEATTAGFFNAINTDSTFSVTGPLTCGKATAFGVNTLSVRRGEERSATVAWYTCTRNAGQANESKVKISQILHARWDTSGWASAWHTLVMGYTEKPGTFWPCDVGTLQAPLIGPVTNTSPESTRVRYGTDFNFGCAHVGWTVHFDSWNSWSATP